jgi:hypothetical protein
MSRGGLRGAPAAAGLAVTLLALGGCGGDPPTATGASDVRTEIQDQTPHHGGVVTMAGFLHVEAAATRDGTVRIWLTDEDRDPVPLERASGHVEVDLPDGGARTLPLAVRGDTLVASGPPFAGDEVPIDLELRRDGGPIRLHFVLPLESARPGVAGVPATGCAPVTPSAGGGPSPRCAVGFPHAVLTLAATRSGDLAVVSEAEGGVTAWSLPAGKVALSFAPPPPAEVRVEEGAEPDVGASAIALRPDGREAVIAFGPRLVRYQVDTGQVMHELPPAPARVRDLAWAPAGPARILVTLHGTPDARVLDVESGETVRTIAVAPEAAAVAFRGDARLGAVGGEVGQIVLFDPASTAPPRALADVLQPVETLAFAGDRVVWAGADRTLRVWGADGVAATTLLPEAAVRVAVAPEGTIVAIALRSGSIELRLVEDGSLVETLRWHRAGVRAMAWAGSVLLTGDMEGRLALWDLGSVAGGL